ncbi:MAG: hypothetical protein HQK54_17795 [Oligoflexales bacterium]|nr:hypothetical protein [Oligoflexales bacterium]
MMIRREIGLAENSSHKIFSSNVTSFSNVFKMIGKIVVDEDIITSSINCKDTLFYVCKNGFDIPGCSELDPIGKTMIPYLNLTGGKPAATDYTGYP